MPIITINIICSSGEDIVAKSHEQTTSFDNK